MWGQLQRSPVRTEYIAFITELTLSFPTEAPLALPWCNILCLLSLETIVKSRREVKLVRHIHFKNFAPDEDMLEKSVFSFEAGCGTTSLLANGKHFAKDHHVTTQGHGTG